MWRDDLRYSLRMLRNSPLFTLAVVLTVALAIGAATAVFTVFNAVLVRPLPFAEPARLVWVAEKNDKLNLPTFTTSALNYQSWLAQTPRAVAPLGAIGYTSFNLAGDGEPEQFGGGTLTASVFGVLGIAPVAGRSFSADEEHTGAAHVAMISEALWRRRFAADPALVGRTLNFNGTPHTIVGIAPAALTVVSPGDVWTPLVIDPATEKRLSHTLTVIGRLQNGITQAQAQAQMDAVAAHVGQEFPEVRDWGIALVTFPNWIIPDQIRTVLAVLLAAVGCVLLIAAANIANLLLARAVAREQEVAIRAALGASRARVLRQLLCESVLLSSAGGVLGALAAFVVVRWAAQALPPNLLPVADLSVDANVWLFALLLSLATGVLFGLMPGLQIANTRTSSVLRAGARSAIGSSRRWLRQGLAIAELALATALLVVAGLLLQSVQKLQHVDLGFDPEHVLTFQIARPVAKNPADGGEAYVFYPELISALAAVPGVSGAAVSSGIPFGAGNYSATAMHPAGPSLLAADQALTVDWRSVSGDFFRVMKIPLLRGRTFGDGDDAHAPMVTIVSASLAQKFWGTDDVVGKTIIRVDGKQMTVVGVVGDVRNNALNVIAPSMYYASTSRLWGLMDVVVRTQGVPDAVLADVRSKIRALDPALPISNVRSMNDWVANSGAQPRLNATLLSAFSALALLIAALGIYGVLAHSVGQRRGEIGLRMALGAPAANVMRLFVGEGMRISVVGILLGVAAALAAGPVMQSLVFGISAYDPFTVATVALLLTTVALSACAIPARRAAAVDPVVALRGE